jgi:y4mF family transcriptional regulator
MDFPERENNALHAGFCRIIFPIGKMDARKITTSTELGTTVRARRKELGLTQSDLAGVARTTLRFVSELERGKPTAQLDGVLRVIRSLGLELEMTSR